MRAAEETVPLEVDRESLLELARGGNLYQTRFAFVRELVQNAIDATLLRAFVEHGAEAFPTYEGSLRDLRASLLGWPVDVTIERVEGGPDAEARTYRIAVEDRGIGIASEDLPHLQRIGSSRKNPRRAAWIGAMPEWMRPSGTFGIGIQSVFLVADELTLESCPLEGDAIEVVIGTRGGGRVTIRDGNRETAGTCASLMLRLDGRQNDTWAMRAWKPGTDWLAEKLDSELEGALHFVRTMGVAGLVPYA